jgi:hypothetical protein
VRDPRGLDDILVRVASLLPPGLEKVREELGHALRAAASSAIERLDLVSREEYDAQVAVLTRTRELLETLERRVGELEAELGPRPGVSPPPHPPGAGPPAPETTPPSPPEPAA